MIFALLFAWFAYLDRLDSDGYAGMGMATIIEILLELMALGVTLHHSGA